MRSRMYKQPIILLSLLVVAFTACEKNETGKTPANHIIASENLAIPADVTVPENLPAGNSRVATYYAEGVQKYKAQPKPGTQPVTYEWVFVAPKADLYDISNHKVGTHSAGPNWILNANTDIIYAQHFAPAKTAPSPDGASIDWLLLKPKDGTTPTGKFTDVAYIQRIATRGGKAPLTMPATGSDTVDVYYTAIYRFTKKNL